MTQRITDIGSTRRQPPLHSTVQWFQLPCTMTQYTSLFTLKSLEPNPLCFGLPFFFFGFPSVQHKYSSLFASLIFTSSLMRSSVVVILYSGSHRQQLPREIIHPCNLFHPSMILNIHSNDSIPSAHCPWCNARGSLICAHGLLFMPCSRPTAHKIATLFESGFFFFCLFVPLQSLV
jgi:hypothetical protein